MKILVSIAALLGTAVIANADPGQQLKSCVLETTLDAILDNTPWMKEMVADDPILRIAFASDFLEGLNEMTDADWADAAADDLSPMRDIPATMIAERWIYDAFADCNQVTQ